MVMVIRNAKTKATKLKKKITIKVLNKIVTELRLLVHSEVERSDR